MADTVDGNGTQDLQAQMASLQEENRSLKETLAKQIELKQKQLILLRELLRISDPEGNCNDDNRLGGDASMYSATQSSHVDPQVVAKAKENAARRDKVPNLCFRALKSQCNRGDDCRLSHDIVPFPYCRSYNDTGECPYRGCGFLHRLYDYVPPNSKPEWEKSAYSVQANRTGADSFTMRGSVDVLYGAAAQPGQYGAPQQIRKRSRSGEYHPALTPWQASQYQTLQSQQPQQPQWQTPKGGEAHTSYGYGAPQHAAYSAPRSISLPAQQHQPSRGNLQTTYRGYGNVGTPEQPAVGWFS